MRATAPRADFSTAFDLSIEIPKQIRDAVTGTNERLDSTNARLDSTYARLEETNANVATLARRQTETEVRLATETNEVARAVNGVRDLLRERLDEHERRIGALERKGA